MKRPSPVPRPVTRVRHTEVCCPRVETLEERLPPGDVLLAKIWGASWFGVNSSQIRIASGSVASAATPVQWSAPESHSPPVHLVQRQAREQTLNKNTQNLIALPATTPIGMDDGLDQLAVTDALSNPMGAHGPAPARHFVSPQVVMTHAVEDGAVAAPVGAPSTTAPTPSMTQPAATEASSSHPANDQSYLVLNTLTAPFGDMQKPAGTRSSEHVRQAEPAPLVAPSPTSQPTPVHESMVRQQYQQLPLSFEANMGQTSTQVQYLAHGSGYSVFLTATSAVMALSPRVSKASESDRMPNQPGTADLQPTADTPATVIYMQVANRQLIVQPKREFSRHPIGHLNGCGNRQQPGGQVSVGP